MLAQISHFSLAHCPSLYTSSKHCAWTIYPKHSVFIFCNLKLMIKTRNYYQMCIRLYQTYTYLGTGWTGRSSIYFTSLNLLYGTWNEEELARQVASMPCLIALIKTDNFDEAMGFVDKINSLQGNPVKSRKKYLVINTPNIDARLMQNKTGNTYVHIMKEGEAGKLSVTKSP